MRSRALGCPTSWGKAKRFLAICQSFIHGFYIVCKSYDREVVFVNWCMLERPFWTGQKHRLHRANTVTLCR